MMVSSRHFHQHVFTRKMLPNTLAIECSHVIGIIICLLVGGQQMMPFVEWLVVVMKMLN